MKTLRILLLLAVTGMLGVVVWDYAGAQRAGSAGEASEPEEIPQNLDSKASRWTWSQSSSNERKVEIHANTVEQIRDTTLLQLQGVELLIYRSDANSFDRIVCDSARFDGETLYSEEEVTVLLGLTTGDSAQNAQPTTIRSSGVTFQSKTGVASTDRYTEYEFEGGVGHSVGSFYDSVHRYFRMNSEAYVERHASSAGQPVLKIRAGELTYYEIGQRVDLKNGASLERGGQKLRAAEAIVHLEEGVIRQITATDAQGEEGQAARVVRFETPKLVAWYSPLQIIEHINGEGPSVMTSETAASAIRAQGNRIDLHYVTPEGATESLLREMYVRESAILEAKPGPGAAAKGGQVRRVSSETLHLKMDNTAENMEFVETMARGRLDVLPVEPDGSRDVLEADRIKMLYAAGNRMEKLQASGNVTLERQPRAEDSTAGRKAEPLHTFSGALLGEFDPGSGDLRVLRQWANFRFEQGDRSGRAEEAQFDLAANQIELKNRAEVWDPNSRTSADSLTLDEESGDFEARGRVSSAYQEKSRKGEPGAGGSQAATGELFAPSKPVYATAERMVSNQRSGVLEYHGKARLWQGADRIEAEQIRIERRQQKLAAKVKVVNVISEKGEDAAVDQTGSLAAGQGGDRGVPATQGRPIEVRADAMRYDEATRQIEYDGSVELRRDTLRVKANELDAWLAPPGAAGSRLEKAIAGGSVEIAETAPHGPPPRQGFGDRAQFFPSEDKVILEGEPARVISARQDTTRGSELTYHLGDDRLLVLGSPQERSYSLRRRKEP
jgi:lipopolysaccharide export system protein LptA